MATVGMNFANVEIKPTVTRFYVKRKLTFSSPPPLEIGIIWESLSAAIGFDREERFDFYLGVVKPERIVNPLIGVCSSLNFKRCSNWI